MLSFYNDFEYATRESAAKRSPLFYIHLYLEVKPVAALPLPYYYGYEAEQFSFYRIPKRLFEDDRFRGVSTDAKLLYGSAEHQRLHPAPERNAGKERGEAR